VANWYQLCCPLNYEWKKLVVKLEIIGMAANGGMKHQQTNKTEHNIMSSLDRPAELSSPCLSEVKPRERQHFSSIFYP